MTVDEFFYDYTDGDYFNWTPGKVKIFANKYHEMICNDCKKDLDLSKLISTKASIYGDVIIGENTRIDDFCILSGKIRIGNNIHIGCGTILIGEITLHDYSNIAPGCTVLAKSDDFRGRQPIGPQNQGGKVIAEPIVMKQHSVIGAGSVVLPGVILEEGTAIGANSLVKKGIYLPWKIYAGSPVKYLKDRI
ncbi:MAG TPA: acyltransferase [Candidatus Dojkabacteria bacterium]|jgi:galactoside O-acetyltransferase